MNELTIQINNIHNNPNQGANAYKQTENLLPRLQQTNL